MYFFRKPPFNFYIICDIIILISIIFLKLK